MPQMLFLPVFLESWPFKDVVIIYVPSTQTCYFHKFSFFITYIPLYMLSHACMHIQLDSFFLDSYLILSKGKIHTQEKKHIAPSNCPHFHCVGAKLTGEEWQQPPNILKMPRRSAIDIH